MSTIGKHFVYLGLETHYEISWGRGGGGTPPPPTVHGKNRLISENLFALQSNVIFPTARVAGRDKMSKKPSSAQR